MQDGAIASLVDGKKKVYTDLMHYVTKVRIVGLPRRVKMPKTNFSCMLGTGMESLEKRELRVLVKVFWTETLSRYLTISEPFQPPLAPQ